MSKKKNDKPERDVHEYVPPKWLKIEGVIAEIFLCILALYVGVVYGTDFITGFAYTFLIIVGGNVLHEYIVERPVRHQWILQHMREYHPDEIID